MCRAECLKPFLMRSAEHPPLQDELPRTACPLLGWRCPRKSARSDELAEDRERIRAARARDSKGQQASTTDADRLQVNTGIERGAVSTENCRGCPTV